MEWDSNTFIIAGIIVVLYTFRNIPVFHNVSCPKCKKKRYVRKKSSQEIGMSRGEETINRITYRCKKCNHSWLETSYRIPYDPD